MNKYRYFMDIDSEEQWLNKMADKGCEGSVILTV